MLYLKNNEWFVENTDIEIKQFKNGMILTPSELANHKIKPDYYKIGMLEFTEREFKTITAIKQYLKSEIGIQRLLNAIMDNDMDKLSLLKKLKQQKKEINKLKKGDNISKLATTKQIKINKGIRKNKGK